MAIELQREIDNTGLTGDYWRLDILSVDREGHASGKFRLYKDSAAASSGKGPTVLEVIVRKSGAISGSTTLAQIQTALQNAAIEPGAALAGGVIVP